MAEVGLVWGEEEERWQDEAGKGEGPRKEGGRREGRRGVLRTPRVARVGTVPAAAKVVVNSPFLFIASDLVAGASDDFSQGSAYQLRLLAPPYCSPWRRGPCE